MNQELQKISEELQGRFSPKQLAELARDLEILAQDEHYKQYPEETNDQH